jgi:DNA-binding response OmpR family regulator
LYKILIIDSNSIFGTTFAGLLKRSGYQVEITAEVEDGLALFPSSTTDLVLLGINVDDPSPFAAASRLPETVKLIALLSREKKPTEALKEVLHLLRDCPVFYKPFRTEEVLAAIYAELVPQEK